MGKLYIYDVSSAIDRRQADGRFSSSEGVTTVEASNVNELLYALDQLIAQKKRFNRALFQTHGNAGAIFFGSDRVDASLLRSRFQTRLYNRLFVFNARLYFDGCNVASGEVGWQFLEAAARTFLTGWNGEAMGWTSLGAGLPGWVPFIGGHTVHPTGDARIVKINHNGDLERVSTNERKTKAMLDHIGKTFPNLPGGI